MPKDDHDHEILNARRAQANAEAATRRAAQEQQAEARRARGAQLEEQHDALPPPVARPPMPAPTLYVWAISGSVQSDKKHVAAATVEQAIEHWKYRLAVKDEQLLSAERLVALDGLVA